MPNAPRRQERESVPCLMKRYSTQIVIVLRHRYSNSCNNKYLFLQHKCVYAREEGEVPFCPLPFYTRAYTFEEDRIINYLEHILFRDKITTLYYAHKLSLHTGEETGRQPVAVL